TDLPAVPSLAVAERARIGELRKELKLSRSAWADPQTALRVGKLAGATHLVTGSFAIVGGKLRLDARVVAIATGKVAFATSAEGERDAFFEVEKQVAKAGGGSLRVPGAAKGRGGLAGSHTLGLEALPRVRDRLRLFVS